MSDFGTVLDRPYAWQAETRAAATRYLERTGNDDLLDVLGLVEEAAGPLVIDGRTVCPACKGPLRDDGRRSCRRARCELGPKSREAQS